MAPDPGGAWAALAQADLWVAFVEARDHFRRAVDAAAPDPQ